LNEVIEPNEWLVFSGSVPDCSDDNFHSTLVELLCKIEAKKVIDSTYFTQSELAQIKPEILKINYEEFQDIFKMTNQDAARLDSIAGEAKAIGSTIIVTNGSASILCSLPNGDGFEVMPTLDQLSSRDSLVGSGDFFMAGLLYGISKGRDLKKSVTLGMRFGIERQKSRDLRHVRIDASLLADL
jgi:fructose-1-phosphate kinase PfkB-like protein